MTESQDRLVLLKEIVKEKKEELALKKELTEIKRELALEEELAELDVEDHIPKQKGNVENSKKDLKQELEKVKESAKEKEETPRLVFKNQCFKEDLETWKSQPEYMRALFPVFEKGFEDNWDDDERHLGFIDKEHELKKPQRVHIPTEDVIRFFIVEGITSEETAVPTTYVADNCTNHFGYKMKRNSWEFKLKTIVGSSKYNLVLKQNPRYEGTNTEHLWYLDIETETNGALRKIANEVGELTIEQEQSSPKEYSEEQIKTLTSIKNLDNGLNWKSKNHKFDPEALNRIGETMTKAHGGQAEKSDSITSPTTTDTDDLFLQIESMEASEPFYYSVPREQLLSDWGAIVEYFCRCDFDNDGIMKELAKTQDKFSEVGVIRCPFPTLKQLLEMERQHGWAIGPKRSKLEKSSEQD